MSKVIIKKDKKGSAYIVEHIRCGYHECIFLTKDELVDLNIQLRKALGDL